MKTMIQPVLVRPGMKWKALLTFVITACSCLNAFCQNQNRDSADYYLKLGAVEENARRCSNAWRFYDKAAYFDPTNPSIHLRIADVCFLIRNNGAAIKALESACALLPREDSLQWRLIRIYYSSNQYQKVIELLPKLREHYSNTPDWAFMMGKSYYLVPSPDYSKAMEYLNISLKENHPRSEAAYLIARMLSKMENYAAAIPYFKHSLSLDTVLQPTHLYDLALVLCAADNAKEAVAYFKKARESGYPVNDGFEQNNAIALADAGLPSEAISILEMLLTRRQQDLGLIRLLIDICYQSEQYKKTISYCNQLLTLEPANARALYQIGLCLIKTGKEKEGKAICDKAIELDPSLRILRQKKELFSRG